MTASVPVTWKKRMRTFWKVQRAKPRLKSATTTRLSSRFPNSRGSREPIWTWPSIRNTKRKSKRHWMTRSVRFVRPVPAVCRMVLMPWQWIQIPVEFWPWLGSTRIRKLIKLKTMRLASLIVRLLSGLRLKGRQFWVRFKTGSLQLTKIPRQTHRFIYRGRQLKNPFTLWERSAHWMPRRRWKFQVTSTWCGWRWRKDIMPTRRIII